MSLKQAKQKLPDCLLILPALALRFCDFIRLIAYEIAPDLQNLKKHRKTADFNMKSAVFMVAGEKFAPTSGA